MGAKSAKVMIVSILFQRSVTYKCKVFCFCPVLKKLCKKDIFEILQKVSRAVFVWDEKERKNMLQRVANLFLGNVMSPTQRKI